MGGLRATLTRRCTCYELVSPPLAGPVIQLAWTPNFSRQLPSGFSRQLPSGRRSAPECSAGAALNPPPISQWGSGTVPPTGCVPKLTSISSEDSG